MTGEHRRPGRAPLPRPKLPRRPDTGWPRILWDAVATTAAVVTLTAITHGGDVLSATLTALGAHH